MKDSERVGAIAQRWQQIRQHIPDSVRLIAVSKTFPAATLRAAYEAGVRDFGENRIAEAIAKQEQLQDLTDICWHCIGHIQSNKAKKALQHFQWLHTCDSLKLAQRLDRLAAELKLTPQVCLQVKVLPDPDKYGWTVPELLASLPQLNNCEFLKFQGLMTILPLHLTPEETLAAFEAVGDLGDKINAQNYPNLQMQEYSMGMSGDYLLALQAGATQIRLGQAIFGSRDAFSATR
ncbi:MAG: YggS family pyridoxal phosphate-dependent enzyme [Jaaginema sp. PMC 1079.18]|nr:YggS family pyridoxal phosphate-dependent enzyme [Jaaginema sp. PMC 1080.18]MEC4852079.1 YggS family pyridoxal phosphate-dependent enzyme [Jaaginema sp. PMC 1079.18]MEC4867259.1 YggS family pyridoxal phosphate-dependent enzyme [Jaaginema sp. PMC 1078.18]